MDGALRAGAGGLLWQTNDVALPNNSSSRQHERPGARRAPGLPLAALAASHIARPNLLWRAGAAQRVAQRLQDGVVAVVEVQVELVRAALDKATVRPDDRAPHFAQ